MLKASPSTAGPKAANRKIVGIRASDGRPPSHTPGITLVHRSRCELRGPAQVLPSLPLEIFA